MAEGAAVAASVIAIIQITDRVIGLCNFYIDSIKDVPADIRVIRIETTALKEILETLEAQKDAGGFTASEAIFVQGGTVSGCHQTVSALEKLFPSQYIGAARSRKLVAVKETLAWPFKADKARKLLDEMMRYKSSISLALTTQNSQAINDIKDDTADIRKVLTDRQRQDVYQWLRHTDPSSLHHRAQKSYEPGTADWVPRSTEWADWFAGKQRCLWIHGIPGAGKTVMMSHLIEHIRESYMHNAEKNCVMVYYYCFYGHSQDESKPFLKWLLVRLCQEAEFVPAPLYQTSKEGNEPSSKVLLEAVAELMPLFSKVYIVIDAIDESDSRIELLGLLHTLCTNDRYQVMQVIAASRDYSDIQSAMIEFSISCPINNKFVQKDIRVHVRAAIAANSKFRKWPPELLQEIEQEITIGANGMFRWAACQIDAIQRLKPKRSIVMKAIRNLPRTLYDTYDRVLMIVPEDERLFIVHALQWVTLHLEMLSGVDLPVSILLGVADRSVSSFSSCENERFFDVDVLKDLCGCLIEITPRDLRHPNMEPQNTIGLAHFTVAEYLRSDRGFGVNANDSLIHNGAPNDRLLKVIFSNALQSSSIWRGDQKVFEFIHHKEAMFRAPSSYLSWQFMYHVVAMFETPIEVYCLLLSFECEPKDPAIICQRDELRRLDINKRLDLEHRATPYWSSGSDESLPGSRKYRPCASVVIVEFSYSKELERKRVQLCHFMRPGEFEAGTLQIFKSLVQLKDFELLHWSKAGPFCTYGFASEVEDFMISALGGELLYDKDPPCMVLDHIVSSFSDASRLLLYGSDLEKFWGRDAEIRYTRLLQRLLRLGATIDSADFRSTPLQQAVDCTNVHAVHALLEAGAQPNLKSHLKSAPTYAPDSPERRIRTKVLKDWRLSPLAKCRRQLRKYRAYMSEQRSSNETWEEGEFNYLMLEVESLVKIEELLLQYGAEEIYVNHDSTSFGSWDSDVTQEMLDDDSDMDSQAS